MSLEPSYSLVNPLSLITNKDRDNFTRNDLLKIIEKERIELISFLYPALDGKLKQLRIPITSKHQAEQILSDGERVDGSSLFKGIVDTASSDLYVVPLYKTAFINPFDSRTLSFICRYFTSKGELAPYTPDTILHNAYTHFRENVGLDLHAFGELEFYLFLDNDSSLFSVPKQQGYHMSSPFLKAGKILDEMVREIARITGAVKYAHSEVGIIESVRSDLEEIKDKRAEQLEIEFHPTPINDTGDILALSRWLIRNIAFQHGCVASFSPKIEEGTAGNGLHVHLQLMQKGKNIMRTASGALSSSAQKLVGGLCHYAESLTAFGNTVSSAYLRLVPNQEAPISVCWGHLNRSTMIRVPLGWSESGQMAMKLNPQEKRPYNEKGERQTIELRSSDGSAIIHLLLAGVVMAAEWGLSNPSAEEIAEKHFVKGNLFKNRQLLESLPSLPKSCVESASLLLQKRALYERNGIFPSSIIDFVSSRLRAERDEGMNALLSDLPADDRLTETRKIMHRCLHRH